MAAKRMNFSAVNDLMRLDAADSEALLEVLSEYFHPPCHQLDLDDSDFDSDEEPDPDPNHDPPSDPSSVPDGTTLEPSPMDEGAYTK